MGIKACCSEESSTTDYNGNNHLAHDKKRQSYIKYKTFSNPPQNIEFLYWNSNPTKKKKHKALSTMHSREASPNSRTILSPN